MNPNAKSAGIAILNYAYHTCDQFAVPRSEIGSLLIQLGEAVAEGQWEPKPVVVPEPPLQPLTPLDTRILELWKAGKRKYEIARELGCNWNTVHVHVKASLPEPQSDPASG